jgi:hypothetical protein
MGRILLAKFFGSGRIEHSTIIVFDARSFFAYSLRQGKE